ncbi:MAG: deoxyribodipyrimidine photo-lyase, partial [Pseudomonadota bacterium]
MTSVVWFKRDLRVSDHPALARAAALGPVIPLYVFEPGYWAEPDVSGRQFDFV